MATPFASRGGFTGYFEQTAGSSFGHSRTSFERGRPLVNGSGIGGQRQPVQPSSQRNLQLFRNSPQALSARAELDALRDQHSSPAGDIFGPQFGKATHGRGRVLGREGREGGAGGQLPSFLYALLDAQAAVDLPPPDRMRGVHLNNRELDKLVNNLGRSPVTWRRSLLLHTWLQDLGHWPDARLCTSLIKVASSHGQGATALGMYEWMRARREEGGAALHGTVHTYTVAMRAALAANMLPQALKVWDDAIASSCKPDCRMCTALIEICTRKGDTERALGMYREMRASGPGSPLAPTVHTYTAAMRAAAEGGAWEIALDIWNDMEAAGCRPSAHAYSAAISACAVGGQWEQAVKHFDNMLAADVRPDVVSCTALMTALGRVGQWERAERTIAWMHRTGVRPNVRTYTAYIAALGTAREWTRVANVLKSMRDGRSGVEPNAYTYAALLKVMGEQGAWELAESLFLELEQQALEQGTIASLQPEACSRPSSAAPTAIKEWPGINPDLLLPTAEAPWSGSDEGLTAGLGPDLIPKLPIAAGSVAGIPAPRTSAAALQPSSCPHNPAAPPVRPAASSTSTPSSLNGSSSGSATSGMTGRSRRAASGSVWIPIPGAEIRIHFGGGESGSPHSEASSEGFAAVPNALAEEALQQSWPDADIWLPNDLPGQSNTPGQSHTQQLPASHAAAGQASQIRRGRQDAQSQQGPGLQHDEHGRGSGPLKADAWTFDLQRGLGQAPRGPKVQLNEVISATMMSAYHRAGRFDQALGVLERAQNAGVPPNAYMRNIALSALGKCGRWLEAERLFNSIPAPDTIAHETLMAAYSLSGQAERAERLFERMLRSGHQPRDYAYCSLIAGHSLEGDWQEAMRVRTRMQRAGVSMTLHVYNALIAACERVQQAGPAVDLYNAMQREGIRPNFATLTPLAHMGQQVSGVQAPQWRLHQPQLIPLAPATGLVAAVAAAGGALLNHGPLDSTWSSAPFGHP